MTKAWLIIFSGIIFAIGFIVFMAFLLERLLEKLKNNFVLNQLPQKHSPPINPELSEKLR